MGIKNTIIEEDKGGWKIWKICKGRGRKKTSWWDWGIILIVTKGSIIVRG